MKEQRWQGDENKTDTVRTGKKETKKKTDDVTKVRKQWSIGEQA